jgi:hypothetical protein
MLECRSRIRRAERRVLRAGCRLLGFVKISPAAQPPPSHISAARLRADN